MAGSYSNRTSDQIGPNTKVPDGSAVVATPAPDYATPVNPPVATTTASGATITNQPVVDARGNVIGSATVVQPAPVWVTQGVAQSGPGATDKTRPGYPDDNTGHSAWDVGTSSAGG